MHVLSKVSTAELAEAADANFVNHASWAAARTPGMRVLAKTELVLVDSGLPCDTFNILCCAHLAADQAVQRIHTALALFAEVKRPFSWWVGPADQPTDLGDYLMTAGLLRAETELAMAADLAALPSTTTMPPGLEIRRVRTEQEIAHFAQIIGDPYALRFYELTASALLTPDAPQWFYLGYWHGQPVATAELTLGGGVVGLYSVITLEAYRRRGIGSALTLQPLLNAREHGFYTGVLQAAAAGVGVYTRLGFKPFGNITEYKPPPATA
ncbi:MAG: GNAT family N-acetyltransferase [Caldilineaceae bacterium]